MSKLGIGITVCILALSAACSTPEKTGYTGGNQDRTPMGSGASTPEKTFKLFCQAILTHDYKTAEELTVRVMQEDLNWQNFERNMRMNHDSIAAIMDDARVEAGSVQTNGSSGMAIIIWGNGIKEPMEFTFQAGVWRIGRETRVKTIRDPLEPTPGPVFPGR